MDRLPPELLTEILSHLAPRIDRWNKPCFEDWLSAALVNRLWSLTIQPLLFQNVRLDAPEDARSLKSTLLARSDLAALVKRLDTPWGLIVRLNDALKECTSLQALQLRPLYPPNGLWIGAGRSLRVLDLVNLSFSEDELPPLENLVSLNAIEVDFLPSIVSPSRDRPPKFPALLHAAFINCGGVNPDNLLRSPSLSTVQIQLLDPKGGSFRTFDLSSFLEEIYPTLDAIRFILNYSVRAKVYQRYSSILAKPKTLIEIRWMLSYLEADVFSSVLSGAQNLYLRCPLESRGELGSISVAEDEELAKKVDEQTKDGKLARTKDISFIYRISEVRRVFLSRDLANYNPIALAKSGEKGVEVQAVRDDEHAFKFFTEICKREK